MLIKEVEEGEGKRNHREVKMEELLKGSNCLKSDSE